MNINNLKTKEDLKELVIDDWGYTDKQEMPSGITFNDEIRDKILVHKLIAEHKGFQVLYFKLEETKKEENQTIDGFLRSTERAIISCVDKQERRTKLFIFSFSNGDCWHFVNVLPTSQVNIRRFSIQLDNRNRLRTASEQLSKLQVLKTDSLQDVISKHESAFDLEEVTVKFFNIFSGKFVELMDIISNIKKGVDKKQIADNTQIILNRILFLKFIEKKGWLDGDKDYLYNKFQNYYKEGHLYWNEILVPLFDLLSNKHTNPDPILGGIPFLNGGLFGNKPSDLTTLAVPNDYFKLLFEELLNHFNFTIEESSPSSVEVAVDPEMLGRIFEALILTIEKSDNLEQDLRRATGAYYTPRTVVFYMSRIAIAKSLSHKTAIDEIKIRKLIDLSVDEIPDENQLKECPLDKQEAGNILGRVENITICDPAVGSGAFLLSNLQILSGLRRFLSVYLGENQYEDYNLKENIIRDNLIGIDILKQAVHICELRLWLSLAVDHKAQTPTDVPTLPNLSYKVFQGDSIVDHIYGQTSNELERLRKDKNLSTNATINQDLIRLISAKKDFFHLTDDIIKERKIGEIDKLKNKIMLEILEMEHTQDTQEQSVLFRDIKSEKKIAEDLETYARKKAREEIINYLKKAYTSGLKSSNGIDRLNFVWLIDLVEFFVDHGKSGFDIVIGNPPYGLKNDSMVKGKERYNLGSKDSFGVFMAMAINELLKDNGILSFITSDTWQTIKSHRDLRKLVLENIKVHEILMMPSWIFGATVNTSIFIATKINKGKFLRKENDWLIFKNTEEIRENELIACDFTRADKKKSELEEYIYSLDNPKFYSAKDVAFYKYSQGLVTMNSTMPLFIASPKLFHLVNDTSCNVVYKEVRKKERAKIRQIRFNNKDLEIVRFGDIAKVKKGIDTGDNHHFLYQDSSARGTYRDINSVKEFMLTDKMLREISINNVLKKKVTLYGFHKTKNEKGFDGDLWFAGKYIVPYDKGGGGNVDQGFLPNYHINTSYFIDWSQGSVKELYLRTSNNVHQSTLRNRAYWFKSGITFSLTGVYAPTFRIKPVGMYDNKSSGIFSDINTNYLLGILTSKLAKFIMKNYFMHTVDTQVGVVDDFTLCIQENTQINNFVTEIVKKQKDFQNYNYFENEQKKIDKLVYKMYGLNDEDIQEVERWYARRYPKLEKYCDIKD